MKTLQRILAMSFMIMGYCPIALAMNTKTTQDTPSQKPITSDQVELVLFLHQSSSWIPEVQSKLKAKNSSYLGLMFGTFFPQLETMVKYAIQSKKANKAIDPRVIPFIDEHINFIESVFKDPETSIRMDFADGFRQRFANIVSAYRKEFSKSASTAATCHKTAAATASK